MNDIPKEKIQLSLTSDRYPDAYSIVNVTIEGRKQTADEVFDILIQKFNVVDQRIGCEESE